MRLGGIGMLCESLDWVGENGGECVREVEI
jgi:hypothetical protein